MKRLAPSVCFKSSCHRVLCEARCGARAEDFCRARWLQHTAAGSTALSATAARGPLHQGTAGVSKTVL